MKEVKARTIEKLAEKIQEMRKDGFITVGEIYKEAKTGYPVCMMEKTGASKKTELKPIMKKIKVSEANKARIEALLKEAAGKAQNIATYDDVIGSIKDIEKKLSVAKKYLDGITANVDPWSYWAKNLPNSYRYTPQSVQFRLVNIKKVWYLTGISKQNCHNYHITLILPEATRNEIINNYNCW